jgi:predicted phosphodiesterase
MRAHRIGLIADIHSHEPEGSDLPATVLEAFRGCELILLLGDAGESAVLDRLATCAPVQATRGADDSPADPRMADGPRCVSVGDSTVGAVFEPRSVHGRDRDQSETPVASWQSSP